MTRLTSRDRVIVSIICTVEQWTQLALWIWLIGFKGWSAWWILLAVILIAAASPSNTIMALERG